MFHNRFGRNMTLPPCGEVCSYTGKVVRERKLLYPQLQKHIECDNIMKRMAYRYVICIGMCSSYRESTVIEKLNSMHG